MLKEQNDFWVNIEQSCLREREKKTKIIETYTHTHFQTIQLMDFEWIVKPNTFFSLSLGEKRLAYY